MFVNRERKLPLLLAAAMLLGGCGGGGVNTPQMTGPPVEQVRAQSSQANPLTATPALSVADAVERISPSVVGLTTTATRRGNQRNVEYQGVGTGVIVHGSGYVLTNHHVAGEAASLHVVFADGSTREGKTLWSDAVLDLAIVQIGGGGTFPAAELGSSEGIRVGDPVFAVGTPLTLQFQHTVTQGVISAKHRTLQVPTETGLPNFMEELLQTDASINPGNSGGPLVDAAGRIVGINTIKVIEAEGIGFAIPIEVARPIIDHFVQQGRFTSPYMGVYAVDQSMARFYDDSFALPKGLYVLQIDEYGPAYEAGVRKGDILLRINGADLASMLQLRTAMHRLGVGGAVTLEVMREGRTFTARFTLTANPAQ